MNHGFIGLLQRKGVRPLFVGLSLVAGHWSLVWAEERVPLPTEVTAVAPVSTPETVLIDEELPVGATATGTWQWETAQAASGTRSHGHPAAGGLQQHSVTFAAPILVPRNGEIATSVWLDPANPPRGIMIKFTLEGGEESGVYWEGEEEVFNPGEEEEIWYYGLLPEYGAWSPLAVVAEDLGIEEVNVIGITFVTYDGRALWDRTVLHEAAPLPDLGGPAGAMELPEGP